MIAVCAAIEEISVIAPAHHGSNNLIEQLRLLWHKIDLSHIDVIAGGAQDHFHLTGNGGSDGFTGAGAASAGELRFTFDTHGQTLIKGDANGDGVADFEIALATIVALSPGDFIL